MSTMLTRVRVRQARGLNVRTDALVDAVVTVCVAGDRLPPGTCYRYTQLLISHTAYSVLSEVEI